MVSGVARLWLAEINCINPAEISKIHTLPSCPLLVYDRLAVRGLRSQGRDLLSLYQKLVRGRKMLSWQLQGSHTLCVKL